MQETITIEKINEVHIKVNADPGIKMELSDLFTFEVAGYKFTPAYKSGFWDGKIRLFNSMTGIVYGGLKTNIINFAKRNNIKCIDETGDKVSSVYDKDFGYKLAKKFNTKFEPRDYQNEAIVKSLNHGRMLNISPTASGKSFIMYLLSRYYQSIGHKTLIIVPTIGLVTQMCSDFRDYSNGESLDILEIKAGVDKSIVSDYTVSTWQSITKMPKEWFSQFGVIMGDEAHLFKAKSLSGIMEKTTSTKYKFGFTGSLDDSKVHSLVLQGLFGEQNNVIRTSTLIENKTLAQLKVDALILKYSKDEIKTVGGKAYQDEVNWLISNEKRNKFIRNLAETREGNTLILFQHIEKHGKVLYDLIKKDTKKPLYYIDGSVSGEDRENIRLEVDQQDGSTLLASFGTTSTGINIVNIDNIIFALSTKSKIRVLQSIGRGLRKGRSNKITIYDIVDDLRKTKKSKPNYSLKHFKERIKMYTNEKFKFKMYDIPIK